MAHGPGPGPGPRGQGPAAGTGPCSRPWAPGPGSRARPMCQGALGPCILTRKVWKSYKHILFGDYLEMSFGKRNILSEPLTENPTLKKQQYSVFLSTFHVAKKNRTAIPINLTAVSRRHLLYESDSCKKSGFRQTPILRAIFNSGVAAIPNSRAARIPISRFPLIYSPLIYYIRTHMGCYPAQLFRENKFIN